MIADNFNKINCSGCGACMCVCPKSCIQMVLDKEGFNYPHVNIEKCIDCGLCEKVCPWRNENNPTVLADPFFFAGQLKQTDDLRHVSSGGAALALSRYVINQGGVVYGAAQEDVDHIYHIRIDNTRELKLISKSKYLQSDISIVFTKIQNDLEQGLTVLFFGTGCQVASVRSFLGIDYSRLITVDVVCHGVPSEKVWKAYREFVEKKNGSRMIELSFRDKSKGWKNNQYCECFENGIRQYTLSIDHPFHKGYLDGLFSRPSCGNCKFNYLPRTSDITLADYWKYSGKKFAQTTSYGVSLIACNTSKGKKLVHNINMWLEEVDRDSALKSCYHMNHKPIENRRRAMFFRSIERYGFEYCYKKYIKNQGIILRIANKILGRVARYVK